MLLPYDKAAYRSVNCGIVTIVYVHSVLWSQVPVRLARSFPKMNYRRENLLFHILLASLLILGSFSPALFFCGSEFAEWCTLLPTLVWVCYCCGYPQRQEPKSSRACRVFWPTITTLSSCFPNKSLVPVKDPCGLPSSYKYSAPCSKGLHYSGV